MPTVTTKALLGMMAAAGVSSVAAHFALGLPVLSVTAFILAMVVFYCIIFAWTVRHQNVG